MKNNTAKKPKTADSSHEISPLTIEEAISLEQVINNEQITSQTRPALRNFLVNTEEGRNARHPTLDELGEMMERGDDVSKYMGPIQKGIPKVEPQPNEPVRVNVDFTYSVVKELNELSMGMNVSRQSVIKMLVRLGLDQLQTAENLRK